MEASHIELLIIKIYCMKNLTPWLIASSRKPDFYVGNYCVVSQKPDVISDAERKEVVPWYLPQFLSVWADIEQVTGYRWKNTSYLRASPSHSKGHSFDLAPEIAPSARSMYSVYSKSDPVLYKRKRLIQALQKLKYQNYSVKGNDKLGIFIEPDHLHIQILDVHGGGSNPAEIVKWRVPKPIYHDTYQRMNLPLIQ
jgi:hypothetical protein